MFGRRNVKAFVSDRDGCKCEGCGKKNLPLEVRRILERIGGAADAPSNLISL
ncbi:MAG: hypothetical protein LBT62_08350 [Deltaproteobacteria bacterium]|jgi:hypothetical protein|nr:hypothetical protein [Deltaproteobacteria bacterium]